MHKLAKRKFSFTVLVLILVLIVGLAVAWSYQSREWDGKTRFTIIALGEPIQIKSLDPASRLGIVLSIPDTLEIESVSGRGKWQASAIVRAGKPTWVADSVADYLGLAYQGIEGSLSWWDKLGWYKAEKNITWRNIDLDATPYLESSTTPDGVKVEHITSAWDNKSRDWFADSAITNESLGVEIVNSTQSPGLGVGAARIVESMGFKVRGLSASDDKITTCVVKTQPDLKSILAVKKLIKTFGCIWQIGQDRDLTLILGDEYRLWKTGD